MTKILRSIDAGNVGSSAITQAQFQSQASAQVDALRQLVGNADITAGTSLTDPLNSPITLYVDPNIGSDSWEGGSYNSNSSSRIDNQRLVAGYSPNRPFRTINRAVIEAAILTSKSYLAGTTDLVTIYCSPGEHQLLNGAGTSNTAQIQSWGTSKADTKDAAWNNLLTLFNDPQWGVILPRGVTICGWDLRKTIIRPTAVPSPTGTIRRRMLRLTSDCYFFGFSFKDAVGASSSHHNLACFGFAGKTALDLFYTKIRLAFDNAGTSSNLSSSYAVTQTKEYQIVTPAPVVADATADTTFGSSPYVFNCSLRSDYGLCGIDVDGSLVEGLKSLVTAQFTNVSLQKDMNAFEKYSSGAWSSVTSYAEYLTTDINNLRYKMSGGDDYRSFGIRASNGAFVQAVSIFVIGDAVHHWAESGAEITITNSNSNFGGVATLASGFKGQGTTGGAFPQDTNFLTPYIRRAKQIPTDGSNIRLIYLGLVQSVTATSITLTRTLDYEGLLTRAGYSLKENDYIWIENSNNTVLSGAHFKAQLGTTPYTSGATITVKNNANSNLVSGGVLNPTVEAAAVGNRVYVRRLVDNRTAEQREVGFIVQNVEGARRPQGSYVIRLDRNGFGAVADQLDPANSMDELYVVADSQSVSATKSKITFATPAYKVLPVSANSQRAFAIGTYYRRGDVVVYNNRYYRCKTEHKADSFVMANWVVTHSNLPVSASTGGIDAPRSAMAPAIILDGDTSSDQNSMTLGWDLSAATGTTTYIDQLRSASDYRGMRGLMLRLGYAAGTGASQVDGILHPVAEVSRDYDISAGAVPTGKLLTAAPWPLEFNRPSVARAFSFAYEWVGYQNYSKSLPRYQVTKLTDQQTLDVLAVSLAGGRCYNTGSTEEGLLVTPFNVQDLGTGRNLNAETAGLGDLAGDTERQVFLQDVIGLEEELAKTKDASNITTGTLNVSRLPTITTLGTVTTGTWSASTIGISKGGTGLTATPTNGQLLIGNGSGYTLATLTAGNNTTITNTAGGITIGVTDPNLAQRKSIIYALVFGG